MTRTETADVYDVIVVGSGAAALLAATRTAELGARVLCLEKEDKFGGNSAYSGGGIWVPNNSKIAAAGIEDSEADAFAYLREVIPNDQVSDETIRMYIRTAPQMIDYLGTIDVPYRAVPHYPDYYPSVPGWKPGGRTMDCKPVHARELGEYFQHLREVPDQSRIFGVINITILEVTVIQALASGWRWIAAATLLRYFLDIGGRLRGKRDRRVCLGGALVGRLFLAMLKHGVDFRLNSPVTELLRDGDRITGVTVTEKDGRERQYKALRGVIIAAGGFEKNEEMRKAHLANPTSSKWSAGSPGNTGDLIRAGKQVGAATGLMHEAWWAPAVLWDDQTKILFFEKSKPGLLIVDSDGKRFMNESITYNSYGKCMYGENYERDDKVPAYVIFDSTYRQKYVFGGLLQGSMSPDVMNRSAFGKNGMLVKANTLHELAEKLGIDLEGLKESVTEMARFAKTGVDEKFGRGSDAHDRMAGDESVKPNPCLRALDDGPYYGAPLYPGDIGTKGGLVIDDDAQVLDDTGKPIDGLFAAGNSTASIMGDKYPGAGCTLGPALTMAFRASNRIMERPFR